MNRAEERLLNPPPGGRIEAARAHGVDLTLLVERCAGPRRSACATCNEPPPVWRPWRQSSQNFARSGAAHLIDFEQALTEDE
jgi:hypothetical protein